MKRLMLGVVAAGIAAVAPAQFFDKFDRADSGDLGTDWTLVVPTTQIVSDEATNGTATDGLSIVTGVNEPVATSVASVDAFAVAGSSNHVAVVIGFAGVFSEQALYAKIWDSDGDGEFDIVGLRGGNDGAGLPVPLSVFTPSARISVWSDDPDSMTMGIDRDFDGIIDESHTRRGMRIWGTGLGTGIGLGIHGGAIADNFSQGFVLPEVEVLPDSFSMHRGFLTSGALGDLFESDDSKVTARAGITLFSGESPLQIIINGTSPTDTPAELRFTIESGANTPGLRQTVQMFNYRTSLYEDVDVSVPGSLDTVTEIAISTSPERFVESGTGRMRVRLVYKAVGIILLWPWSARLDQTVWTIVP